MKRFFTFLFIFIIISNGYGFSIIERLKIPSNCKYLKEFNIKLNKIKKKKTTENIIKQEAKKEEDRENISDIFNLTGIFKIGNNFFAIINGNSYPVGGTIRGYKILSINIKKVTLLNLSNNKKAELQIEN